MRQFSALVMLVAAAALQAAPPSRIRRAINNNETFVLEGHRSPLVAAAQDLAETDSSLPLTQLELHFKMTPAQAADLSALLQSQRDRASKQYHKWLSPEQFGARFGLNQDDLSKVRQWLEDSGFEHVQISRSRTFLRMSGNAGTVRETFGVPIHSYVLNGRQFYANAADPVLPRALNGLVSNIRGLNNYRLRPHVIRRPHPQISVGINGNHFLAPHDLATVYDLNTLYNQGTDGTGQSIAVVGQSDINMSDIEAFQAAAGLPIKDPQVVMAGDHPGFSGDNELEADLDLEWSGAVARGATILYVNSPDVLTSAEFAVEENLAPVLSISYGLCEAALAATDLETDNAIFQQANAQGITVLASSGDSGAAGCDDVRDAHGNPEGVALSGLAVNFPASSPYVTAVGGTEFDDAHGSFWNSSGQATSYIPEIAWNDTGVEKVLSGTGGGVSQQFAKPSWQVGAGVPNDGFRDVPDIALSASPVHDPYLLCSGGSCSNGFAPPLSELYFVGGTSCAAPVFAGMVALLNQSTQGRQGNVNAGLYALASFSSGLFHDVELGDNRVPCLAGSPDCSGGSLGFSAGPGYDQVTGLGSVDAAQLIEQWGSDFQVSVNPALLHFTSGTVASATLEIARFASFSGTVNLTCTVAGSLTNTTCTVPPSVTGSGIVQLTVANSSPHLGTFGDWRTIVPRGSANLLLLLPAGTLLWAFRKKRLRYAALAAFCALSLVSCGSDELSSTTSASQPLTGNVTVTATSGILQHSMTVPVTISPSN